MNFVPLSFVADRSLCIDLNLIGITTWRLSLRCIPQAVFRPLCIDLNLIGITTRSTWYFSKILPNSIGLCIDLNLIGITTRTVRARKSESLCQQLCIDLNLIGITTVQFGFRCGVGRKHFVLT